MHAHTQAPALNTTLQHAHSTAQVVQDAWAPGGTTAREAPHGAMSRASSVSALRAPAHAVCCDTPQCITARARAQKDSWAIDYQATLNALEAARGAGASHFVLLSGICVQRPLLEFQRAKLRFEGALQAAGDITYSIVRPTAFFKSLSGQARAPGCPTPHPQAGGAVQL